MREAKETIVNGNALQLAQREMQRLLASHPTLVAVGAAGIVAGLAGPFGTMEHLALLPRLAYWLVLCAVSYLTGAVLTAVAMRGLTTRGWSRIAAAVAGSMPAGLVIAAEVAALNWAVFGLPPVAPGYLAMLGLNGIAIALVITLASVALTPEEDAPAAPESSGTPPLLDRLPLDKRGALVALSVQDHYVEVVTTRGREMMLMRLSDAIREAAPTPGLQVHRSHWVATGQVRAARRDGARAVLTMVDGRDIPVSRSNVAAVKEAGLLPGERHG
ncbi:hypothetical protein DZD18_09810 [Rhodobacteraceae bacterium W635]|nr:hypothetical protein DZD18_09810 [Rhodobacteraceae bacterium W635]